jgi:glycosyltransferase involved in cell wall biosynthesis
MRKKSILLLGFNIPEKKIYNLIEQDVNSSIQTHKFGWSLANSLKLNHQEIVLLSASPVSTWPLNKKIIFNYSFFKENEIDGFEMPFINILILKHLTRLLSSTFLFFKIYHKKRFNTLIIHGLHSPFLLIGFFAKFLSIKTIVVITDPPNVIQSTDSFFVKFLKKIDFFFIKFIFKFCINGIITLSNNLPLLLNYKKPYLNFPGFIDSKLMNYQHQNSYNSKFIITYAGTLNYEYGLKILIDAFIQIDNPNLELQIFGKGNLEEFLIERSQIDLRIKYFGYLPNSEVFLKICNSSLLVNPRPLNDYVSNNSFPSKIIEYMLSGVPFITTKISTIPSSFDIYLNYFDGDDLNAIKCGLINTINQNYSSLLEKAMIGKEFVKNNYNEEKIGRIIVNYLNKNE